MIKEKEIDVLVMPWINAQVAYLLAVQSATSMVEDNKVTNKLLDPTEYNEVVTNIDSETIDAFSSQIIHVRTKTAFTGVRLNVMTQTLCAEEGLLPQGLMIQNAYTEMYNGGKNVTIVVRNSTVDH